MYRSDLSNPDLYICLFLKQPFSAIFGSEVYVTSGIAEMYRKKHPIRVGINDLY